MLEKRVNGLSFLSLSRQLGLIARYDGMLRALKRAAAETIFHIVRPRQIVRFPASFRAASKVIPHIVELVPDAVRRWSDSRQWMAESRQRWSDSRQWVADSGHWMKNDCWKALAKTRCFFREALCFARDAMSGRWPSGCPDILRQPGFYGAIIALAILLPGTFYLEQRPAVYGAVYARKQIEAAGSPQEVGIQGAPGQEQAATDFITLADADYELQVTEDAVHVRSGPDKNEPGIGQVHYGDILQAKAKSSNDWYQVVFQNETGWIAGWCVQVSRPSEASAPHPGPGWSDPGASDTARGTFPDVVGTARRFLGRPYWYGAAGPASFDCSGFVHYVYSRCGIDLPRVASDQALAGRRVSSPAPGDLVFFSGRSDGYITHVGIYIGDNSFIHASFQGVTITSLDDPWYQTHYVKACSVL